MQASNNLMSNILEHQTSSEIKCPNANRLLINLLTDLLIPFSVSEVSELLQNVANGIVQESKFDQTASKSNVNWRFLTTLISVLIIYFENSSVYIKSVVEKLIVTSLDAEKYGQRNFACP